ncbi:MAG: hypothetical protein IID61_19130 [SAR324 cluster bacterium]|nr:hypothetical protein [SAR324 cluster bacterium]
MSTRMVPGEDFGGWPGGGTIRLSFACSTEQIEAGLERLEGFVRALRQ